MERLNPEKNRGRPGEQGAALVVVLACLLLLVVLAMAFLLNSANELTSSKTYSEGGRAVQLAQSAVSLATAQIQAGTEGVGADGATLAWASQPGMIRTFNDQGNPAGYFKLYSWTTMTGTGAFSPGLAEEQPPANWESRPAFFCDLNEPRDTAAGLVFPIIDGKDLKPVGGAQVYDADGNGVADISGFSVRNAPAGSKNPVPMPVRWIYVLADGQLAMPVSGPAGEAQFSGAIVPSGTNPIVGRMAFWADDETSKVNINTASEGSYWDMPRAYTTQEFGLASYQGVQREFQRYPGHPATTSLSAVFPTLTAEEIYAFSPRVVGGGSLGGTGKLSYATDESLPYAWDRLYASVDELMFQPDLGDGGLRGENQPATLTPATLERARFFLTAHSRAPDLNLFNLPRVSIWPITRNHSTGDLTMTPFDGVSAFASTINGYPYYFQRQDAASATTDLPSTGAASGLGRNRSLLEYLRSLTSLAIPGFGGSFAAKYNAAGPGGGTDRDQILTEIFDYIRSTNLRDSTLGIDWSGHFTRNLATGLPTTSTDYKSLPGVGQVAPIEDASHGTRGFGRFPTVQSAFFQFIGTADHSTNPSTEGTVPMVPSGKIRMEAGFFVQMFDPSQGQVMNKPWYTVEVEGLDSFRWNETGVEADSFPMGFPGTSGIGRPVPWNMTSVRFYGGSHDYRAFLHNRGYNNANRYPLVSGQTGYPGQMPDPPVGGTFVFEGGDVTVRIRLADGTGAPTGPVLQTVSLFFPPAEFPTPQLAPNAVGYTSGSTTYGPFNYRSFYGNSGRLNANETMSRIVGQDVVRAVVPASGDMRLIAARSNVPSSAFTAHAHYHTSGIPFAYQARTGSGTPFHGSTGGKLVNVNYPGYAAQYTAYSDANGSVDRGVNPRDVDVPSTTGVTQSGGIAADWDNGVANLRDGPYINKADEGDNGGYSGSYHVPYFSFEYTGANSLPGPTYFSPNRLMPSAVMFGSLPTGVFANRPWQTLHFRPEPAGHPGLGVQVNPAAPVGPPFTTPPDHLMLDLFHMPVVEPYPISEPLSTAGRVNMNFQIVPFTYIHRDTGIRAVLKSEKRAVIADSQAGVYKTTGNSGSAPGGSSPSLRFGLSADAVVTQFNRRFAAGDIFRSASEICSIDLVPVDAPAATIANPTRLNMDTYWNTRRLTGDNTREKVYATIYPRLTTKSNTFTIHYRAQALKKRQGSDPAVWNENSDFVTGDIQGSETVERFIDPNHSEIPDYSLPGGKEPISSFYRFRTVEAKTFVP